MCLLSVKCQDHFPEMLVILVVLGLHFCFFSLTFSKQTSATVLNVWTCFTQSLDVQLSILLTAKVQ